MDVKIYIATHKQFEMPHVDNCYLPLQVGREVKEDLGYLPDNTGENISEKNAHYCELTGMYWIWKNDQSDIVGLCHYRRYLIQKGNILSEDDIRKSMEYYDMILPDSGMSKYRNVYEHYCSRHQEKDLLCCLEVLKERWPEYETAFLWALSSNLISMGNIMIARRTIFDAYCAWLFDILFEVERRTDFSEYDDYQSRLFGFLSERLLRAWIMMQKDVRILEKAVLALS